MEKEVINIINGLINKTKLRLANWSYSQDENCFSILLGESKVSVCKYSTILNDYFEFVIYNSDNNPVVEIDTRHLIDDTKIRELFSAVESSYVMKDETISSILNILSSSGIVGETPRSSDDVIFPTNK